MRTAQVKLLSSLTVTNRYQKANVVAPDGIFNALQDRSYVPVLKDEVLTDRLAASSSARSRQETLRKEMMDLEAEMKQLQDSLDTLLRMQHR